MSHQPKVITNSSNPKPKSSEAQPINSINIRETNPNQINLNNKQNKRNTNNNNSYNSNNTNGNFIANFNSGNNSNNNNNNNNLIIWTYFDKKFSEEENSFFINSVYTFGSNEMGQIGCDFDSKDINSFSSLPIHLSELTNKRIISISAGDGHSVCVGKDGTVYAWGASACGQLGLDGNLTMYRDSEGYPYQPTPIPIKLISGNKITEVSCGDAHTLALTKDGKIFSFGGAGCGQLGHPNISEMPKDADNCPYQPYPRLIETLKMHAIIHIACGKAHSLCIDSTGSLYTWGAGACGQLGVEDISNLPVDDDGYFFQPVPKVLKSLKGKNIVYGVCGDVHTLVLTDKGEIYSFGGGSFGQLGLGPIKSMPLDSDNFAFMPIPTKIESLVEVNIVSIACGDSHSMAIDSEGRLYAWGAAACGQLGISSLDGGLSSLQKDSEGNPYESEPRLVSFFENMKVTSVACGEAHSLVLVDGGIVYSFGGNSTGQLGYPEIKDYKANKSAYKLPNLRNSDNFSAIGKPQLITNLLGKNVIKLACGGVHNLVLTASKFDLGNSLFKMFREEHMTDFEIWVSTYDGSRVCFKCHKVVLFSRSPFFYELIIKRKESVLELKKYSLLAFKTIIEYLYLDENGFLNELNVMEDLLEYFKITRLLELKTLQTEVENKLKSHLLKFSEALQTVVNSEDNSLTNLNNQTMRNYDQQFRGLYFLPNGACLMLLNEEVIEQVMKNSIIINFNQISNLGNPNSNKELSSISNSNINNVQNSNSSNNKYQSQKNSQDQMANSKIGKINKSNFNNNSSTCLTNNNLINNINNNNSNNNNLVKSSTFHSNSLMNSNHINFNSNNALEFSRSAALGQNNILNHSGYVKSNCNYNYNGGLNNFSSNILNRIGANNPNGNVQDLNANSASNDFNSNLFDLTADNKNKNISAYKKVKNSANENSNLNDKAIEAGKVYDKSSKTGNRKDSNSMCSSTPFNNSLINEISNEDNSTNNAEIIENLNSNNNLKPSNNNNKNESAPSAINYFSEVNSAKLDKSEILDEVNTSLINTGNTDAKMDLNINTNSKAKAVFISEILESHLQLESGSRFKKLFDAYNIISLNYGIEIKDLVDLLKKFTLVSTNFNSNDGFNFNNLYNNNKNELVFKSDNLINEYNKRNTSNMLSSSLSLKSTLIMENNNNINNSLINSLNSVINNMPVNSNMDYLPLGFDLLKYFNDKETSDLKIIVGEHTFYVHKIILICRSKFFELMFNEEMKENTYNEVNLSDYPAEEFFVFLLYLYTDQLQFDFEMALELLKAADMFAAEDLRNKIEMFLSSNLEVENSAKIFKFGSFYNYDKLKKICLAYINDNYKQVIETQEFEELQREYMLEIVRYCKTK